MRKWVLYGCVLALWAGSAWAEPAGDDKPSAALATLVTAANLFRTEASDNVEQAVRKWGTPAFVRKWNREVMTLFDKEEHIEWHDFFSSAVLWCGRLAGREGVVALYSPWSDGAVLLRIRLAGEKTRLTDFRALSGEALRGEPLPDKPSVARTLRLYAGAEIPTLALARLYADSLRAFEAHFPLEGRPDLSPAGFAKNAGSIGQETALIKTRMLHRMRMFNDFFGQAGNRPFLAAAGHLIKALEAEDAKAVLARLAAEQPTEVVETVFEMPVSVRGGFAPNFFGRNNGKVLVGLVSPTAPQWILMVQMEERPGAAPALIMEALDLNVSGQIVALAEKEAK